MKMELERVVARFRSALRPINRIKHVVDFQTAVPVNTQILQVVANTVDAPVISNADHVQTGATVNSVFLTTEVVASETSATATPNFYWMFYKNPGNNIIFPNANAVGSSDAKRFVIHQEMVMINPLDGGVPRNVFKGVIKIPKHLRRSAPNDRWIVQLFIPSTGVSVNACTQAHYKEFR